MNTKTMEGLAGAKANINMVNTPMRIYKEARRKGDTATMERAMGYACEFAGKAEEYKSEADEGMKEDAKEAREKAKLEREKAIEKRKAEREKPEERIEESRDSNKDKVEISEDGKVLLKENTNLDNTVFLETKPDATGMSTKPVTYTKAGEVGRKEQSVNISIQI